MTTIVVGVMGSNSVRGALLGSAEVTETNSWAEVTSFVTPEGASVNLQSLLSALEECQLDVFADVNMRLLVTRGSVPANDPVRGWRLPNNGGIALSINLGERIFVRLA